MSQGQMIWCVDNITNTGHFVIYSTRFTILLMQMNMTYILDSLDIALADNNGIWIVLVLDRLLYGLVSTNYTQIWS